MMNYEELLEKAEKEMPKSIQKGERFEIPKAEIAIEGNTTIIKNFLTISGAFRREPQQILKFLSKEFGTPANLEGQRAVLNSRVMGSVVQKKIEDYAKRYVICKECGGPDTNLAKHGKILMFKCEVCGATYSMEG
ncbi:MAG TPA: translation initiation factor IF-2 subunit beta [archaeon]|nr:translation initiation factor IF-2 subunit beta [archaeon]